MINKKGVLLLGFIFISIGCTLMATEYHVSKDGSDGNDGSKSSPFKTISAAAGKAEPGDVVTVHEGIYRERINPPRGGTSDDKRIIYQTASGEKVVVKGSEIVKGWKKVENDTWEVVLPNTFFGEFNPFNDLISGDWFRNNPGASNHTGSVYLNNKQLTETFSLDKVLRPFGAAAGNSMQYLINISKIKVSKSDKPVAADSFTSQSGIQTAPCTEGGKCIGWIEDGDWAVYEVDFGKNADKVEFRTASLSRNALIELRLDSHEGELLGRCMVTPTSDWQVWKSVTAKIKPVSGVKKLCLVFKDPATTETNAKWFAKVDDKNTTVWAQFNGVDPNKEMVEINVRKTIFYPEKTGIDYITVSGFMMEHAATPWAPPTAEQIGIIGTNWSKGWVIENTTVRHSACSGIALGKHGDKFDNTSANSAEGYVETIKRALKRGWSKENIGGHIVRNNHISDCGQAGIVGSMGAVFSTVTGNVIHDIHIGRSFGGAEMAGIKFHGAIDTTISNNHIYNCGGSGGIWLDWMAQGSRVTGNLLHDNSRDVYMEVNHGPFLFDNNIFLSKNGIADWSQGGAYVHNLIAGTFALHTELRQTPYFAQHSMKDMKLSNIQHKDLRFYNNIFVGPGGPLVDADQDLMTKIFVGSYGLSGLGKEAVNTFAENNIYLAGAKPSVHDKNALVAEGFDPEIKLQQRPDGWWLLMAVDQDRTNAVKRDLVTTELLGKAKIPDASFDQPDGTPYKIDKDYFGNNRGVRPAAGPFELTGDKVIRVRVWSKDANIGYYDKIDADIWVLAGQSNMQGAALLKKQVPENDRIWMFGMDNKWQVAQLPIHRLHEAAAAAHDNIMLASGVPQQQLDQLRKQSRKSPIGGVCAGYFFADHLLKHIDRPVALIPSAHGGTTMDQWSPALKENGEDSLYGAMLGRIKRVGGSIKGILWYQGESDALSDPDGYKAKMLAFIDAVRKDTRQADLPLICVQIGRLVIQNTSTQDDRWQKVRQDQLQIMSERKNVWFVAAADLPMDDGIHISYAGQKRLGRRLAEVALSQVYGVSKHAKAIDVDSIELVNRPFGRQAIRIHFKGVTGHLQSFSRPADISLVYAPKTPQAGSISYAVEFDPSEPDCIFAMLQGPYIPGGKVIYGPGANPYVNIVDSADMPIPCFGPLDVALAGDKDIGKDTNNFEKPYEWPDNQPSDCPFPESSDITKIVFTGRYANYTHADTWFPMWAADGNEYSPFTDGTVDGYMSVGHYTNMHNIYENKNHRTGQAIMVGDSPTNLKITGLGSMSTPYDNFYPCASVIADGVWYYGHYDAFNDTGYFAGWRYSSNWNHFTEEQNYPWKNQYWTCAYDVSDQSRYFDFGVSDELEPGHIAVNSKTIYNSEIGYGWDKTLTADEVRREHAVKTMKDFSLCDQPRTFKVDVENGDYRVLVFIGDRGKYSHDKISVSAEGVLKVKSFDTTAGDPANEVLPFEFDVTVKDGQLDLLFQDGGGKDPYWMVNALYVRPVTDDNFFNEKGKAKFRVPRAVVFGQDNRLSPDDKIYFVSHGYYKGNGTNNWANGDALYLCRVDEGVDNVLDHTKYEFWTGSKWSWSVEDAGPILAWPNNLGGATITWNPGLKKYILVVHHNAKTASGGECAEEHRTILMESNKITGPYKTIHYMTNWGPGSYFGNIPAKWISKDGKTAWMVIAANCWQEPANPKQCIYACSMHEFKFVTSSEKQK